MWTTQKVWSDQFLPEMKHILGEALIHEADVKEDALRNTDLVTLAMQGQQRIACRIRRHRYLKDHFQEFTLRCSLRSERQTEFDKLLQGWGDFLFYGFANETETGLAQWFIGDLEIFRRWLRHHHDRHGEWPGVVVGNSDGSSRFRVFSLRDMDPRFVIKQGQQRQQYPNHPQLN